MYSTLFDVISTAGWLCNHLNGQPLQNAFKQHQISLPDLCSGYQTVSGIRDLALENSTFKSFHREGQSILDMHNKYRSGRTSSICWYYLPLSKSYCMLYAHICHPFELHPTSACWDTWGYPELEAFSCDEALLEKSFRPGDVSVLCKINACSLKSQRVFRNWPHMQVLFKFAVVFEEDRLLRNSVKRPKATHHQQDAKNHWSIKLQTTLP